MSKLSLNECRSEIYAELRAQLHLTIGYLADKYTVSKKTIRRDIEELTLTYPIETVRGHYGGEIKLSDWYHPQQATLSSKQIDLLKKLASSLESDDLTVLNSIISQFSR